MNHSVENRLARAVAVAVAGVGMLTHTGCADMMWENTGSAQPTWRGKKLGITTLSQISTLPVADRTLCDEPEFNSRIDGLNPMLTAYGPTRGKASGVAASAIEVFDAGVLYTATDCDTCNFGEVSTTDGRMNKLGLTALEDGMAFFPAYSVTTPLNSSALAKYPGLADVFDTISPESPRPPCESSTCGWITAAGSPPAQAFVLQDRVLQNGEHVVDSIVCWDPTDSKRRLD